MKKNSSVLFSFYCLGIVLLTGCSDHVSVSGKVLLRSGEPVTKGLVLFENEKISGISDIKPDGSYSIGLIKPGEGIPPGTYNIAIQATGTIGSVVPDTEGKGIGGMSEVIPETSQVNNKYTLTRTSGLSITIKKGKPIVHNITVDPRISRTVR